MCFKDYPILIDIHEAFKNILEDIEGYYFRIMLRVIYKFKETLSLDVQLLIYSIRL
jgi:hypothetical protein